MTEEKELKVPIHYIGQRVYSIASFTKEARELGVSRAMPKHVIKRLRFGDRILLATWTRKGYEQVKYRSKREKKPKKFKDGVAIVFGYFTVTGIQTSHHVLEAIKDKLNVISESNESYSVERGCGSYYVTGSMVVLDSIKDIVKKIEEYERESKESVKVFVTGDFHEFDRLYEVYDVPFTRAMLWVDPSRVHDELKEFAIDVRGRDLDVKSGVKATKISNYEQVKYRSKREKKAFVSLEKFIRG